MTPWFKNVKPHKDIQDGLLDESVFAANLAEVAAGKGREIYRSPEAFFRKTYFTAGLKNIAGRVVKGLNGGQDAENRVISLQTGFGGGKTHTLISLYHLAKWGRKALQSDSTADLITAAGVPNFDAARIAVFTNTTNDPVQGRKVKGHILKTLWGEIAWQLGGEAAYEIVRENDEKGVAPKGLFKAVLEQCKPALILIDELADYCVSAAAVPVGASTLSDQTISFMQELTEAVSGTDNCVLIATLPASVQELASSPVSAAILTALENRITRIGANMKPVEDDEIFEVVRRRLFEAPGEPAEIENVISAYAHLYQSLFAEVPKYAVGAEYREKLRKAYPFHPELIDMFRLRWASNPFFQRTRGVLRILAAIVSDLWKRQGTLTGSHGLIHTSDVHFGNLDALTSQITILNGAMWDSVIQADVSGTSSNAFRTDNEVPGLGAYNITQGVAATALLGTFGSQGQNKGVSVAEIKLCMVRPESFNHNDINSALDRLEGAAHYLYYSTSGPRKYWFHTKPNLNILINQARSDVKQADVEAEILKRIREKTKSVQLFNVLVNPAEDIAEQTKPTLVILSPAHMANPDKINGKTRPVIEKIATKKGNSERIYRNTLLFLLCSEIGLPKLKSDVTEYLACLKISTDYQSQIDADQKKELEKRIKEAGVQIEASLVAAYSIVAKHSAKNGLETLLVRQFSDSFDGQITHIIAALKEEEWLLETVGLRTLQTNNLLPQPDRPKKVKDIYEAFLRFDDKPMITGAQAIANSLLRYSGNGEFCIAAGDGSRFSRFFLEEAVPLFDVTDDTYWLTDKSLKPAPEASQPISGATPGSDSSSGLGAGDMTEGKQVGEPDVAAAVDAVKALKALHVSGKVSWDRYTELLQYFIHPFTASGYKVDIEVHFKMSPADGAPLDESKPQYKSAKEAASQLGLTFAQE